MISRRHILSALAAGLVAGPALAQPYGGRQGRGRSPRPPGVAAGSPAPDFALNDIATGEGVQLSALYAQKPVVLVFGSFT